MSLLLKKLRYVAFSFTARKKKNTIRNASWLCVLCLLLCLGLPPQCGTIEDKGPNEGLTERSLQDAQRLYLMNDVVQPESTDPLVMQDDVRFSSLVVDIVQGMDTLYHVMYISTGRYRYKYTNVNDDPH